LALTGRKLLLSIHGQEMAIHHSYIFARDLAPVLRLLLSFGVLFPFSVLGVCFAARRRTGAWMLASCALAYIATMMAFYVADRYRIVLLPMLIPLAGLGMVELESRFRRRKLRTIAPALGILALSFLISHLPIFPAAWTENSMAFSNNWMGKKEIQRGDLGRAEAYFKKAAKVTGHNQGPMSAWTWSNLGDIHVRRGDFKGARELYLRAITADPENGFVRIRLARIEELAGRFDMAIRWWQEVASLMPDPTPALREVSRLQALKNAADEGLENGPEKK
jgi:tetratricopeptide (TPR) repeat protein